MSTYELGGHNAANRLHRVLEGLNEIRSALHSSWSVSESLVNVNANFHS